MTTIQTGTAMQQLAAVGQSVWLDYIRRDLLESGEMAAMVAAGLKGMTSNPSIFEKAIGGSDQYDDDLAAAVAANPAAGPEELFEALAIEDIRAAADVLRPVYDEHPGADGFVSLEVSPDLAYDTQTTIDEARRLWAEVDRPNLMIKVPATAEGIPAVEQLIADGINVNVTLMFSLDHYEAVSDAFLRGLDRAPNPATVASVASFFVSRVDTKVDDLLEAIGSDEALRLRGQAAVANSRLAYQRYLEKFGEEFEANWGRGALPQRLLWASTSTKNPEYSDVLYVEELIGPNTINTMPPETLEAFDDHGTVRGGSLTEEVDEARRVLDALGDLGVDLVAVTEELQREGVDKFAQSFSSLLEVIAAKRASME